MKVITLDKTKELLGISDTTYDTAISAKIPYIDSKVKLITRNNYNFKFAGDTTLDSEFISVYSLSNDYLIDNYSTTDIRNRDISGINNPYVYTDISESLKPGQLIEGDNIPDDSYIVGITSNGTSVTIDSTDYYVTYIEISAAATATATGLILTGGISIGYQDVIAKGIWYLISMTSQTLPDAGLASRSVGPLNVSFSASSQKIDGKSGMPAWFVKGLPRFQRGL